MTTGRPEAGSPRDDALLSRLYQQVTEEQAARFAAGYDTAAGLARYRAWLGEHTARQPAGTQHVPAADPAQLSPAPPGGPARPRGRGPAPRRRRASWLAPVMAAAAVVAVAATLVIVRDLPGGPVKPSTASSAPASPTGPVAPIAGVPQFYVTESVPTAGSDRWTLVIGDTFTGKRLATIAPPGTTSWGSVTGAADDRTFVVSSAPTWGGNNSGGVPLTWYLLRITPGANPGYRLTRLAIPDMKSWYVEAIGLSGSGKELAMSLVPAPTKSDPNPAIWVVRTYSVATGKLLGNWSVTGTTILDIGITVPGLEAPTLKWVDGDRAIAFYTYSDAGNSPAAIPKSMRLLDVTGGSGNLIADSTYIWSTKIALSAQGSPDTLPLAGRCEWVNTALPQVTTDGKTVVCVTGSIGAKQGRSRVTFEWLSYAAGAPKVPHLLYKVTVDAPQGFDTTSSVRWSGPSGGPMIIEWGTEGLPPNKYQDGAWDTHLGVLSHGQFHPLPVPPVLAPGTPGYSAPIAW
jgi:hypothetical protein